MDHSIPKDREQEENESSQNSGTGREIKFEPQGRANKKIQILKSLKISKFTFDYHVKWQIQEREKNEKKIQTNFSGEKSNLIWRGHIKTKKLQIITDYLLRGENNQLFGGEGKQMQFLRLRSRHCNPLQHSLAFFFRLGKIFAFYSSNTCLSNSLQQRTDGISCFVSLSVSKNSSRFLFHFSFTLQRVFVSACIPGRRSNCICICIYTFSIAFAFSWRSSSISKKNSYALKNTRCGHY